MSSVLRDGFAIIRCISGEPIISSMAGGGLSFIRCTAAGEPPISSSIQEEGWRLLPAPIAVAGEAAVASRAEAASR